MGVKIERAPFKSARKRRARNTVFKTSAEGCSLSKTPIAIRGSGTPCLLANIMFYVSGTICISYQSILIMWSILRYQSGCSEMFDVKSD